LTQQLGALGVMVVGVGPELIADGCVCLSASVAANTRSRQAGRVFEAAADLQGTVAPCVELGGCDRVCAR
jgi:hypothetical protein